MVRLGQRGADGDKSFLAVLEAVVKAIRIKIKLRIRIRPPTDRLRVRHFDSSGDGWYDPMPVPKDEGALLLDGVEWIAAALVADVLETARQIVVADPVRTNLGSNRRARIVLDFAGELYESQLEVCFLEQLRGVQRFSGVEELRAAIERDVATARILMARIADEELRVKN